MKLKHVAKRISETQIILDIYSNLRTRSRKNCGNSKEILVAGTLLRGHESEWDPETVA